MKQILAFTLLILLSFNLTSQYSLRANDCTFELPNGFNVNLSSLQQTQDYKFEKDSFTYYANFCGSTHKQCNGRNIPASVFTYSIYKITLDDSTCIMPLSDSFKVSADFVDPENKSTGIKLGLPQGGQCAMDPNHFYQVYYYLMCDLSVEGAKFQSVVQINNCAYEYRFTSRSGCYTVHDYGNMSTYALYVFMVSMVMIAYCLGFMMVNYQRCPEDGVVKALPHRTFWVNNVGRFSGFINWLYENLKRKNNKSSLDNY
jgi:hypothetical protein